MKRSPPTPSPSSVPQSTPATRLPYSTPASITPSISTTSRSRPLIITLGGGTDKDSGNTEGGVGRDYLLANGVPLANIIAETPSTDTEQQVRRLAQIARENNLHHIVVVSDGTHLFRIRELCEDAGLDVYTSPRPALGHINNYDLAMRYFHEILSYTSYRLHLNLN